MTMKRAEIVYNVTTQVIVFYLTQFLNREIFYRLIELIKLITPCICRLILTLKAISNGLTSEYKIHGSNTNIFSTL